MKNTTVAESRQISTTTTFPANENQLTDEQLRQADEWRAKMIASLRAVGIDADLWIARFDTYCRTFEQKREAHRLAMERVMLKKRAQIMNAIAGQPWTEEDVDRELAALGVPSGFDSAPDDLIEKIWSDYRRARMIVI